MSERTILHVGYTHNEVDTKAAGAADPETDALFAGMIHNF
jgi:hypothetical protein